MLGNISSISFIVTYGSVELEKSLFALLQIAALTAVIYSVIVFWMYRRQVFDIAEEIENIQGIIFILKFEQDSN